MARLGGYLGSVFLLIQFSCASQHIATGNGSYYEDLSLLRPKFTKKKDSIKFITEAHTPAIDTVAAANVNEKVDNVLDSLDKLNTMRRYVDGFTIQLYSGQNREEAVDAKYKLYEVVEALTAQLEYTQPKFRVITGSYFTRLEAQRDLYLLKDSFPNAIVVPERVPIK